VPSILDSRSTFLLGGFGGLHGRPLRVGDTLDCDDLLGEPVDVGSALPVLSDSWTIRVVVGPHGAPEYLTADGAQAPKEANTTVAKTDPAYGLPQAAPYFLYTFPGSGEALWTVKPNLKTGAGGDPNATILLSKNSGGTLPDEDTNAAIGYMRYRHNQGVNASFADGHTKYLREGASKLFQWSPLYQNR